MSPSCSKKNMRGEYACLKLLPATYLAILWRPFLTVKTWPPTIGDQVGEQMKSWWVKKIWYRMLISMHSLKLTHLKIWMVGLRQHSFWNCFRCNVGLRASNYQNCWIPHATGHLLVRRCSFQNQSHLAITICRLNDRRRKNEKQLSNSTARMYIWLEVSTHLKSSPIFGVKIKNLHTTTT